MVAICTFVFVVVRKYQKVSSVVCNFCTFDFCKKFQNQIKFSNHVGNFVVASAKIVTCFPLQIAAFLSNNLKICTVYIFDNIVYF